MSDENTGVIIATHAARLFLPLADAVKDVNSFRAFLFRLGFQGTSVPPEYLTVADKITSAVSDVEQLVSSASLETVVSTLKALVEAYEAIQSLSTAPAGLDPATFLPEFRQKVIDLLVTDYLALELPWLSSLLRSVGVIQTVHNPATADRPAFVQTTIDYGKLGDIIKNPLDFPKTVYGWGTDSFNFSLVAEHVVELFNALDFIAAFKKVPPVIQQGFLPNRGQANSNIEVRARVELFDEIVGNAAAVVGVELLELPGDATNEPGLILSPTFSGALGFPITIAPGVTLSLRSGSDIGELFGLMLRPGGGLSVFYPFDSSRTAPSTGFGLRLDAAPSSPIILLGRAGSTRLELASVGLGVNLDFTSNGTELTVFLSPTGLKLAIVAAEGDGFLSEVLPKGEMDVTIEGDVHWSSKNGLAFQGGAQFQTTLAINKSIGPLNLQNVIVAAKGDAGANGPEFRIQTGVSFAIDIGPVSCSVQGLGAEFDLEFSPGNLGPFDFNVGFKVPTGIGIAVNGGPVSGGGFISFDPDAGRYSGALALQVYSVAVKAFGVIDTKLPAGGPSFSFFIIISADFQPIQLGFGFTLLGVGGLLGINRGLDATALEAAVKAGSIDNILFPKNPIKDAPTILADVEAIFPPTNGTYAFGPLARIGWGTPAIIDARIGIVLIFPGTKIALLGVVTALLPPGASKALALVEIHMDIDGLLDFPKKHFEMDAELHDSQVRGFPISGDMAARMDWGSNPNFAVSLGGFNPHYTPPTGFPTLRRLTIDLGIKGNPSATLQGYMALTSNTAQVGAALSVTAHAGGANLSGGLAFDALFVFSPFSFDASLSGGVHVDFHGVGFGMHFDGEISGPAPWHLHGDVSVSVLWFSASVGFDLTLGGESKPQLPAIDIWAGSTPDANGNQDVPGLQSAVVAPGNWTGVLPPGGYQVVSITQNDSTASRVDPLGKATFQQKVAPFALAISKFAGRNRAKSDVTTVKVQTLSVNSTAVPAKQITAVPDFFAPVQYQNVPDAQALSSPSYQQLQGGFSFSSDDIVFGTELTQAIVMETILIGSSATPQTYSIPDDATMQAMTARSATGTGGLRKANIDRFVDLTVTTLPFALAVEAYALVLKTTLARFSGVASTDSAYALQSDQLAALTPNVRATLQIVPAHEIPA